MPHDHVNALAYKPQAPCKESHTPNNNRLLSMLTEAPVLLDVQGDVSWLPWHKGPFRMREVFSGGRGVLAPYVQLRLELASSEGCLPRVTEPKYCLCKLDHPPGPNRVTLPHTLRRWGLGLEDQAVATIQ